MKKKKEAKLHHTELVEKETLLPLSRVS